MPPKWRDTKLSLHLNPKQYRGEMTGSCVGNIFAQFLPSWQRWRGTTPPHYSSPHCTKPHYSPPNHSPPVIILHLNILHLTILHHTLLHHIIILYHTIFCNTPNFPVPLHWCWSTLQWWFTPHIFYQDSWFRRISGFNNSVSCYRKGCKIVDFHTFTAQRQPTVVYIWNFGHLETFQDWCQGDLIKFSHWSGMMNSRWRLLLSHKMLINYYPTKCWSAKCNKGCKVQHQRFLQPSGSDDDLRSRN